MKTYLGIIAAATLAVPWSSHGQEVIEGYSVLKVCQEDLILHTSDGAEGGRIGYVVVDPGSQRIVSALVTGGVLAERVVAVPFHSMRFNSAREVTLVDIDRARLTSAPVIERSVLTSTTTRFEPSVFERSYTHFGGNAADLRVGVRSETTSSNRDGRGPDRDRTRPDATDPARTDRADVPATDRTRPDSTSRRTDRTSSTEAEKNQPSATTTPESRTSESRRGSAQPDSSANKPGGSGSSERRGSANRPDALSPSGPSNRPDAASEENKPSRPGASSNKPSEERPGASTPGSSSANPSAADKSSGKKDDQAKEAPPEKKTPGADSTDPANRRPDRDNPENKGAAQKPGESSAPPQKEEKTPSSNTGSEADKKPL